MRPYEVTILGSGGSVQCRSGQSILEGMVKLGSKGIPSGCRGGGCGVCKVEIVSGSYQSKPMSRSHVSAQDELDSRGLACRVFPTSDISLRVIGSMSRAIERARLAA